MTNYLDQLAVEVAKLKASYEADLLSLCWADHSFGVQEAKRNKIGTDSFDQPDLRLLWCAADVCQSNSRIIAAKMAWKALESEHYASSISLSPTIWSKVSLWKFIQSNFGMSATLLRYLIAEAARRLLTVNRRIENARSHLRAAETALLIPSGL